MGVRRRTARWTAVPLRLRRAERGPARPELFALVTLVQPPSLTPVELAWGHGPMRRVVWGALGRSRAC